MTRAAERRSQMAAYAERTVAWLLVLLMHLAFGEWLLGAASAPFHPREHERTPVSFIAASQKTNADTHPLAGVVAIPVRDRSSGRAQTTAKLVVRAHAIRKPAAETAAAHANALDDAAERERITDAQPYNSARRRIFAESTQAARFNTAPERFKMKPKMTAELVVREFGRLAGLWPPGYTDDPCPGINRTIEEGNSVGVTTDAQRRLLSDAMMVHQRFCQ